MGGSVARARTGAAEDDAAETGGGGGGGGGLDGMGIDGMDPADLAAAADQKSVPHPDELRTNAALCLCALVSGNAVSREAAKKAGAVDALSTMLDGGDPEWEGSYLAAMGMQALGLGDEAAQEKAISPGKAARASVRERGEARTDTLHGVWALKSEPSRWQR